MRMCTHKHLCGASLKCIKIIIGCFALRGIRDKLVLRNDKGMKLKTWQGKKNLTERMSVNVKC